MLDLSGRESLGKHIHDHLVGRAVGDLEGALLDDPSDEVIAYINMFSSCVVLVVFSELPQRLVPFWPPGSAGPAGWVLLAVCSAVEQE